MGMKMDDGAAQATLALLKLAKEIADGVVGDADSATLRAVFERLCIEVDARTEGETLATTPAALH